MSASLETRHRGPIARRTLAETLADRLRAEIVDGTLPPGQRLGEQALCERLGVSRTPLREALRMLAAEGLVTVRPGRGALVSPITLSELEELFPVIGALEALAGELAASRITDAQIDRLRELQERLTASHASGDLAAYVRANAEIHAEIRSAANNATLSATIAGLDIRLARARALANLSSRRWAEAVDEHAQILGALERRDGPALARLLKAHLGNKFRALADHFADAG